jgi:hypothetical protein
VLPVPLPMAELLLDREELEVRLDEEDDEGEENRDKDDRMELDMEPPMPPPPPEPPLEASIDEPPELPPEEEELVRVEPPDATDWLSRPVAPVGTPAMEMEAVLTPRMPLPRLPRSVGAVSAAKFSGAVTPVSRSTCRTSPAVTWAVGTMTAAPRPAERAMPSAGESQYHRPAAPNNVAGSSTQAHIRRRFGFSTSGLCPG